VNHIKELAPLLADIFIDAEVADGAYHLNIKKAKNKKHLLGNYVNYIGSVLHDSQVLSVNINKNRYSLLLNDFASYLFADAIIEKFNLDINNDKLIFPLTIEFTNLISVNYYNIDEEGFAKEINPIKLNEYLYDQVLEIEEGNIKMAFVFWRTRRDSFWGHKLVIINCKSVTIKEDQEKAWTKIFKGKYLDYYHYFRANKPNVETSIGPYINLANQFDCLKP